MSATLTWASSGNGTKTGTTIVDLINNLDTLVTSKSGDATFLWETAGKKVDATPYYYLMRRKDASAGRIGLIHWSSAPAANNSAILDSAPGLSVYPVWFPNGTGTTLSNLTAASGTICGTDTGVVKVSPIAVVSTSYAANLVPFYFDSAEGVVFGFANPAAATTYWGGAGDLLIDGSDNVYGCTFGSANNSAGQFGSSGSPSFDWAATAPTAGSATNSIRTNYGSSNRVYKQALQPTGTWASQAVGANDVLTDTAINKVGFLPVQLLAIAIKCEGFVLKFRQIAWGPGSVGPFTPYQTTGPVVQARQFCNTTAGNNGSPWMVNFKI